MLLGGVFAAMSMVCCGLEPPQYLQDQHHPNKVRCHSQKLCISGEVECYIASAAPMRMRVAFGG
jgi:hypothetical protein